MNLYINRWHKVILMTFMLLSTTLHAATLEEEAQIAGQEGMDYLTQAAINWQNVRGGENACFACHTQGLTVWGASIGKTRGFEVNPNHLESLVKNIKNNQHYTNASLWSHPGGHNQIQSSAFAVAGLAFYEQSRTGDETQAQVELIKAVDALLDKQKADGSWASEQSHLQNDRRDVVAGFYSDQSVTSSIIIAVRRVFEILNAPHYEEAYQRAASWLENSWVSDTQSYALKIMALFEAQYPVEHAAMAQAVEELLARQNPDGGFGRFRGTASSPFQTGVAVYTLRLIGYSVNSPEIEAGLHYLVNTQNINGSWPWGGAKFDSTDKVAPSMWPVIALGNFGEFGVDIVATPEFQELLAQMSAQQSVTFDFEVTNTGVNTEADTFDLVLSGGKTGVTESLSDTQLTLGAGESKTVTLTVTAPADLCNALQVTHSLTATSVTNPETTAVTNVTSATRPLPPPFGNGSKINILAGANTVLETSDTLRIAVQVVDAENGNQVHGSCALGGTVNFFVAGQSIGGDNDLDGNGVFEITWSPGWEWTKLGNQPLLITFSGINNPEPLDDLMFSFANSELTIIKTPDTPTTIGEDVIGDIDVVIEVLPVDASPSLFNHFNHAQDHIAEGITAYEGGDNVLAVAEFNEAIAFLNKGLEKLEGQVCATAPAPAGGKTGKEKAGKGKSGRAHTTMAKPDGKGKACVDADSATQIENWAKAAIVDLNKAIALL